MMAGKKLEIAIPIFHDLTALDAIGPYEVLQLLPNAQIKFVSHKPGLLRACRGSLSLQATASFEEVPNPQVVLVPGGPGSKALMQDQVLLDWLRKVHDTTLFTTSVCTGSHLLAAAGILRGLEATTHWNTYDVLSQYGAKPVAKRVVRQGKILTAAGVSSGIDMALELAALIADETTAKVIQLLIEYDPQPPFDTGSVSKAGPELTARTIEFVKKIVPITDL
ncbi:hypothetical protein O6H91_01G045300 [Diphasiastrum complanatum]|uniref:Uncharacterized protein n=6 Tax=Diphasiastrum complanatum TaxID=34168 RepID=A0ACC2EQF4_DIPCM|nr:hypothetical protein O6H91_15G023900 [Diphasiastrum complanatum]KAJ7528887.1 hypothetical protein O6H91_15G024000 [Diphasiastrum complanatum]KAJ7528889.1 hypothetical protein O6H91_15G024200 [Diphasiastrum complanatum]KAJ7528897.1 hypothetical protein O6H91_15G024700 [Diphasiastrum complanatum]KAJ7529809.1 hypothetical protein O6H91_15G066600 [Diphasiastrum complanatum]